MKTAAPGKLVLSGAYAVLWGAPAIVTAVDRYVIADSSRTAELRTAEVDCALGTRAAPWFDARALRADRRKLGLGSSAAIVVASLGALALDDDPTLETSSLRSRVFPVARSAHRTAQGGGSGVDVAASCFGGTLRCAMRGEELGVAAYALPPGLEIVAYADRQSSSTANMVSSVKGWAALQAAAFERLMGRLGEQATRASDASSAREFMDALRAQVLLLADLGDAAGVPIVPEALRPIATDAAADGVVVMPSGAGGGDMVLCVGSGLAGAPWGDRLAQAGLERLELRVDAVGLRRA